MGRFKLGAERRGGRPSSVAGISRNLDDVRLTQRGGRGRPPSLAPRWSPLGWPDPLPIKPDSQRRVLRSKRFTSEAGVEHLTSGEDDSWLSCV